MVYPHDLNKKDDIATLLQHVTTTNADIVDWKKRMIGEQFDPKVLIDALESHFPDLVP
jgi:hypothetical protein